jgi:glyoxalase family protein
MRYTFQSQEGDRHRFIGGPGALASVLDISLRPGGPEETTSEAVFGAGSIHHIAFRVPTDEAQGEYQTALRSARYDVTPVIDRKYFHSIYYREPGGVLFEIATEPPGFSVDEPMDSLGEDLKLPPWFEPNRLAIEQDLPRLTLKPLEKAR